MIPNFEEVRKRPGVWPGIVTIRTEASPTETHHSVVARFVALRFAAGVSCRFVDSVPVFLAVDEVYAWNLILQQFGAAVVIGMSVRKNHIFDLLRIQSKLLHAVQDLVFRGIVEQRLDDDDALAAHERPRAVDLGAQEIEVIGDFSRFGVPRLFGRDARGSASPTPARTLGAGEGGMQSRRKVPDQSVPAAVLAAPR